MLALQHIYGYIIFMAKTPAAKKKPGRPALEEGAETVPITLRMTPTQREKLARLGGAKWVRGKIDAAREPAEKAEPQGD